MRRIFVFILILVAGLSLRAQKPQTFVFAQREGEELKMDFYEPQSSRSDRILVLYMFGGGFVTGQRDDSSSMNAVRALLKEGYVVASIDYRLGLRTVNPDTARVRYMSDYFGRAIDWAVEDCAAAVAYLYHHSKELNLDPTKFVLTGSSAGAISVLQMDYCRANSFAPAAALPEGFKPLAVIPYAGAICCPNKLFAYATPPAPTCLFHGTWDRIVNYNRFRAGLSNSLNGANRVAKLFAKKNFPYWFFRVQDRGHDVANYLPITTEIFTSFVEHALAGKVATIDAQFTDPAHPANQWSKMNIFQLYLH